MKIKRCNSVNVLNYNVICFVGSICTNLTVYGDLLMHSNVIIFIGPNRADLAAGGGGANAPNAPCMATGLQYSLSEIKNAG